MEDLILKFYRMQRRNLETGVLKSSLYLRMIFLEDVFLECKRKTRSREISKLASKQD
jgi:hypothetical protein